MPPITSEPAALRALPPTISAGRQPITALAPMQEVTDLAFMQVVAEYGAPDYYFTEFFRVHSTSRLDSHILRSIDENQTGRPTFAQIIGEDLVHLARTAAELERHAVAGVDLNLGCPAPRVYRKNVGGGLLREPEKVDEILRVLRATVTGPFTVKMRVGFDDTRHFERILESINRHGVDLLTVHGRTVKEMYRAEVHYDLILRARNVVVCPVLANGNVTSAERAQAIVRTTDSAGVMIGRHAIRNPWIFKQCRERFAGKDVAPITLGDVRGYIERLYAATRRPGLPDTVNVKRMKRYLSFIGVSVDTSGAFLHAARRAHTELELFSVCDQHLLAHPERAFALEPYAALVARPNEAGSQQRVRASECRT